jgi:hypothetical protein
VLQPTAVEQARRSARSAGLGIRAARLGAGAAQTQLNVEFARLLNRLPDEGRRWQLSVLFSVFL